MAAIRLVVWAIRGMTLGRAFINDRKGIEDAVALLSRILERVAPNGTFEELADL